MDGAFVYELAHFLHVVGALGLPAAVAVEATGLVGLRRSNTGDAARAWLQSSESVWA